ncbi:hypothetical protein EG327_011394 [Venturia inaequalis]|uniref:Uncharacterized protein n=1 Tax=Venturia inaequalis TaxID=5025 RepID=A0A8H3UCM8_VENIN|nr:hypothetical protein EG327_011394 [Venturia inaequalis]
MQWFDPINGVKIYQDDWDSYTARDERGEPLSDIAGLTDQCLGGRGTFWEGKLLGTTGITLFPNYLDGMQRWANNNVMTGLELSSDAARAQTMAGLDKIAATPDNIVALLTNLNMESGKEPFSPIDELTQLVEFTILHELAHAYGNGLAIDVKQYRSFGWMACLLIQSEHDGMRSSSNCAETTNKLIATPTGTIHWVSLAAPSTTPTSLPSWIYYDAIAPSPHTNFVPPGGVDIWIPDTVSKAAADAVVNHCQVIDQRCQDELQRVFSSDDALVETDDPEQLAELVVFAVSIWFLARPTPGNRRRAQPGVSDYPSGSGIHVPAQQWGDIYGAHALPTVGIMGAAGTKTFVHPTKSTVTITSLRPTISVTNGDLVIIYPDKMRDDLEYLVNKYSKHDCVEAASFEDFQQNLVERADGAMSWRSQDGSIPQKALDILVENHYFLLATVYCGVIGAYKSIQPMGKLNSYLPVTNVDLKDSYVKWHTPLILLTIEAAVQWAKTEIRITTSDPYQSDMMIRVVINTLFDTVFDRMLREITRSNPYGQPIIYNLVIHRPILMENALFLTAADVACKALGDFTTKKSFVQIVGPDKFGNYKTPSQVFHPEDYSFVFRWTQKQGTCVKDHWWKDPAAECMQMFVTFTETERCYMTMGLDINTQPSRMKLSGHIDMECGTVDYYIHERSEVGLVKCFSAYKKSVDPALWTRVVERWCDRLGDLSQKDMSENMDAEKWEDEGETKWSMFGPSFGGYTFQMRWKHREGACHEETWPGYHRQECINTFMDFAYSETCRIGYQEMRPFGTVETLCGTGWYYIDTLNWQSIHLEAVKKAPPYDFNPKKDLMLFFWKLVTNVTWTVSTSEHIQNGRITLYDRYNNVHASTTVSKTEMKNDSTEDVREFSTPTGYLSLIVVLAKSYENDQFPTLIWLWRSLGHETYGLSRDEGIMFQNKQTIVDTMADKDKDIPIKDPLNKCNDRRLMVTFLMIAICMVNFVYADVRTVNLQSLPPPATPLSNLPTNRIFYDAIETAAPGKQPPSHIDIYLPDSVYDAALEAVKSHCQTVNDNCRAAIRKVLNSDDAILESDDNDSLGDLVYFAISLVIESWPASEITVPEENSINSLEKRKMFFPSRWAMEYSAASELGLGYTQTMGVMGPGPVITNPPATATLHQACQQSA